MLCDSWFALVTYMLEALVRGTWDWLTPRSVCRHSRLAIASVLRPGNVLDNQNVIAGLDGLWGMPGAAAGQYASQPISHEALEQGLSDISAATFGDNEGMHAGSAGK